MARIVGVDLPKNKRGVIGLTYIYGIGRSTSSKILATAGIDENIKVCDWTDDQVGAIRATIAEMGLKVEGECRSLVQLNIKRLMDIGATVVSVTVLVFPFVVSRPRTTHVLVRVARRL